MLATQIVASGESGKPRATPCQMTCPELRGGRSHGKRGPARQGGAGHVRHAVRAVCGTVGSRDSTVAARRASRLDYRPHRRARRGLPGRPRVARVDRGRRLRDVDAFLSSATSLLVMTCPTNTQRDSTGDLTASLHGVTTTGPVQRHRPRPGDTNRPGPRTVHRRRTVRRGTFSVLNGTSQ